MPYAAAAFEVGSISQMFKALGDDVRLRIVALLTHGELCVCHIETALELTQPNASRHLGLLRAAGLVETRRRDKWVYYRLAEQRDPARARQLDALIGAFAKQAQLRKDVVRLTRAMGPNACR